MEREISPPPLKRRKVQEPQTIVAERGSPQAAGRDLKLGSMRSTSPNCFRVFSWNINGVQPFLPPSHAPITSFFKPVRKTKRTREREESFHESAEVRPEFQGNPLRAFLQRHRWPEVVFLQELKISPSDKKMPSMLLTAINSSLGKEDVPTPNNRYTLDVNLPRDNHNARGFGGKLYGVGTLLREDFASMHVADIRHADWDLEGRVTVVELRPGESTIETNTSQYLAKAPQGKRGADDRPLALVNIYAVNGTSAPYRSPETGKVVGTRHDHKLAFHTRLRDECLDLERRGFNVVIAGDLNIARGVLDGHPNLRTYPRQHCMNRADFNAKFFGNDDNDGAEAYTGNDDASSPSSLMKTAKAVPGFDGVDVFRALRGKERRYTYHPRRGGGGSGGSDDDWGSSCDRVDLIVVSRALFDSQRVVGTDILDSPQERGTSDHVPLWVELRLNHLEGDGTPRGRG